MPDGLLRDNPEGDRPILPPEVFDDIDVETGTGVQSEGTQQPGFDTEPIRAKGW